MLNNDRWDELVGDAVDRKVNVADVQRVGQTTTKEEQWEDDRAEATSFWRNQMTR